MKKIRNFLLLIYAFYLIYLPDFSPYLRILPNTSVIVILLAIINSIMFNRKIFSFIRKQNMKSLLFSIMIVLIQVIIVNFNNNFYLGNIWPILLFAVQIVNYSTLLLWYFKINPEKDSEDFLMFLIYLGLIQACLIIIMRIVPSFKNVAEVLYGGTEGVRDHLTYLLSYRIYGIASSYTFMLPLIQAFIATISLYRYSQGKDMRFMLFSLVLIYSSTLNGRTGLYIYIIIFIVVLLRLLLSKATLRMWTIMISATFIITLLAIVLYIRDSNQFSWVFDGMQEIIRFLTSGETEANQNVGRLVGEHVVFPSGFDIVFGIGQSIFGGITYKGTYIHSDIGYINDLFRGGIFFVLVFYSSVYWVFKRLYKDNLLFTIFVFFFLIANYKGELILGTPVIMLIYLVGILFKYSEITEETNKATELESR